MAAAPFGPGGREGAEEGGSRGRVSETVSGIGMACGSRPRGQGLVGKQEVAARPCACEHAAASGRGEEDDGGLQGWVGPAGGAGPGKWRQVGGPGGLLSLSIYLFCLFLFNLFCHCFEFKIIQTMPKTPLNILYC